MTNRARRSKRPARRSVLTKSPVTAGGNVAVCDAAAPESLGRFAPLQAERSAATACTNDQVLRRNSAPGTEPHLDTPLRIVMIRPPPAGPEDRFARGERRERMSSPRRRPSRLTLDPAEPRTIGPRAIEKNHHSLVATAQAARMQSRVEQE